MSVSLLKRRIRWLVYEPRLGWLALLAFLLSLGVLYTRCEPLVRWWGMILQFVGIYAVIRELLGAQAHFNRPGIKQWFGSWRQKWPRKNDAVDLCAEICVAVDASASASVRSTAADGASLDERILVLEKNLSRIDNELQQATAEIEREARELRQLIKAEEERRAAAVIQLEKALETVAVSTLPLSLFGVVCLGFGVLLSTTAPELVKWLGFLFERSSDSFIKRVFCSFCP